MSGIREKFRGPSGGSEARGLRGRIIEKQREKQEQEGGREPEQEEGPESEKSEDGPKTLTERLKVAKEQRERAEEEEKQKKINLARQALIDAFKAKQAAEMAERCRIPGQEDEQ